MRNTITFRNALRFVIIPLFTASLIVGCTLTEDIADIKDAVSGITIKKGTPSFKNSIFIDIQDQNGDYIHTSKIRISGADGASIFDNSLNQTSDFTYSSTDGRFSFILNPNISPAVLAEKRITFNVTPIANGYTGFTQQVILSGEKLKLVTVKMIDKSAKINGVVQSTNTAVATDSNGRTVKEEAVMNSEQATVIVSEGTILKNSKGQPIKGKITSEVIFFNPISPEAQALIGTSLVGEIVESDGSTASGKLVSAGMFKAILTSGNDTVKTLSGSGLVLKARIPDGLLNPTTGEAVKEGEVIAMWSVDEGSGTWKYEKDALVKRDNVGLYLKDTVNHLSSWNWDWHVNSCFDGPTFNWNFVGFNPDDQKAVVTIQNESKNVNPWSQHFDEYVDPTTKTKLLNVQRDQSGTLTFKLKNEELGKKLRIEPASIEYTDLCSLGEKTITIVSEDDSSIEYYVKLNLNISGSVVDQNNRLITPSFWFDYNNQPGLAPPDAPNELISAGNFFSSGKIQVVNGKTIGTLPVIPENDILIKAIIGSRSVQGKIRINYYGENKDQLQLVVSPLSKSDTYKPIILNPIAKPARGSVVDIEYKVELTTNDLNKL